ncbi:OmcA/MtrC family decaheme c-type cytochrome [Shewanella sp. C32]|uniref:OmcA/MtrC family decaheme c-type cytochrome n=1 Tax=Shewanella electrica TaxID=515560 RepID=A0ABT2FJU8_9GAMM|nr:OmcA/MtrC family decaheme c-type cytochrome [Shewanella electrica]MCH1923402.1 OmcA/MtrC family decaheme c-type cytochrome [Shewanella electrica]MCS4555499.1 OmcA/MtrC family decaheme c-type cytochrome [Shewanella electrica]
MMKRFRFNTAYKALLGAGILSLALVGCGGSGEDGQDGTDGEPGLATISITNATTLNSTISSASVTDGTVTVDFMLTNANGVAITGLTNANTIRFGIAQLTHIVDTAADGSAGFDHGYQWQSYINTEKAPDNPPTDVSGITPQTLYQAGIEAASGCDTCLVDNGDGSYKYTYQQNIANVTTPVAVAFDANDTQRVTIELSANGLVTNAHYDWQPSSGATDGIQSRDVVSIETCYTCHQPDSLKMHGGSRTDIQNCVVCHTSTSGDPESGNSIDFTYMIHAIHRGEERHTFNADGEQVAAPYKIIGYRGNLYDFGKVAFPRSPAADCSVCHVEGANAPKDAALFTAEQSNTACIACHSEKPSNNHSSTDCMSCHQAESPYHGTGSAVKRHGDVLKANTIAQAMSVAVSNVATNDNGQLTFNVQVLDQDGNAVDQDVVSQSSRVVVAWDIDKDFPAYDAASYSQRRISLSAGTFDSSSRTYTITATTFNLPADAQGKNFEIWSTLQACFNNGGYGVADIALTPCANEGTRQVTIQQTPYRFVWGAQAPDTTASVTARRNIIDPTKCQGCHGAEIHHYTNGVNCGTCHTPDKTLRTDASYPGGKTPTSFAFKAHHREGHELNHNGMNSGTVIKSDCMTCHTNDGIVLGRSPDRVWRFGDLTDGHDIWVSSDAGACLSCHQPYLTDAVRSHIETNGGVIDGASIDEVKQQAAETCKTCHTVDQLLNVHGN